MIVYGVVVNCKNSAKKIEFFTKTIKEYCDTKRLRELHISAAKERIKSGVKRGSPISFAESLERIRRLFD